MISILAESKFIAFTNDAWKRFWDMDWNVMLLLQVKTVTILNTSSIVRAPIYTHKNAQVDPKGQTAKSTQGFDLELTLTFYLEN